MCFDLLKCSITFGFVKHSLSSVKTNFDRPWKTPPSDTAGLTDRDLPTVALILLFGRREHGPLMPYVGEAVRANGTLCGHYVDTTWTLSGRGFEQPGVRRIVMDKSRVVSSKTVKSALALVKTCCFGQNMSLWSKQ